MAESPSFHTQSIPQTKYDYLGDFITCRTQKKKRNSSNSYVDHRLDTRNVKTGINQKCVVDAGKTYIYVPHTWQTGAKVTRT